MVKAKIQNVDKILDKVAVIRASGAMTYPRCFNPALDVDHYHNLATTAIATGEYKLPVIEASQLYDLLHTRAGGKEDHRSRSYQVYYDTTCALSIPTVHPNTVAVKMEDGRRTTVACVLVPLWASRAAWLAGLDPFVIASFPLNQPRFEAMVTRCQKGFIEARRFWINLNADIDPYVDLSKGGKTRFEAGVDHRYATNVEERLKTASDDADWHNSDEIILVDDPSGFYCNYQFGALLDTAHHLPDEERHQAIKRYIKIWRRNMIPRKAVTNLLAAASDGISRLPKSEETE